MIDGKERAQVADEEILHAVGVEVGQRRRATDGECWRRPTEAAGGGTSAKDHALPHVGAEEVEALRRHRSRRANVRDRRRPRHLRNREAAPVELSGTSPRGPGLRRRQALGRAADVERQRLLHVRRQRALAAAAAGPIGGRRLSRMNIIRTISSRQRRAGGCREAETRGTRRRSRAPVARRARWQWTGGSEESARRDGGVPGRGEQARLRGPRCGAPAARKTCAMLASGPAAAAKVCRYNWREHEPLVLPSPRAGGFCRHSGCLDSAPLSLAACAWQPARAPLFEEIPAPPAASRGSTTTRCRRTAICRRRWVLASRSSTTTTTAGWTSSS